jgi:uncharacterized protein (DUF2141 family)
MPRPSLLSAAAFAILAGLALPAAAGDLSVTLAEVSAEPGTLYVGLWSDAETFRDADRAVARITAPAAAGSVTVTFPDLAPGTYAVMAYHDADGDGEMDRFLGMIPTEGYALSNDPKVAGPPPFDAAAFPVGPEGAAVTATMRY